jgi:flagellar biosynthesis protein FlhF
MMNRMKVFGADSVEAMAKITRELGGDARIYSTRRVNGGIEIIAGKGDDDEELRPQLRPATGGDRAQRKQKVEDDFATLLASARKAARAGERFAPMKASEAESPAPSASEDTRLSALEESVAEIKSMLGCSMMTSALTSAGASPELIAIYLAQAGAHEKLGGEKKFGNFLARRMTYPDADKILTEPRVFVALGPSGSGKTTLLAQMVARLRVENPNGRVSFVNANTNRLMASEGLRSFGSILNAPTIDVETPEELVEFTAIIDPQISIFIDMPSDVHEAKAMLAALESRAEHIAPIMRLGVIPSNLSLEAATSMMDRYGKVDAVAITKLGECNPSLNLLGNLSLRKMPVAYLSTSAHLTRGLVEPVVDDLDNLIRGNLFATAAQTEAL